MLQPKRESLPSCDFTFRAVVPRPIKAAPAPKKPPPAAARGRPSGLNFSGLLPSKKLKRSSPDTLVAAAHTPYEGRGRPLKRNISDADLMMRPSRLRFRPITPSSTSTSGRATPSLASSTSTLVSAKQSIGTTKQSPPRARPASPAAPCPAQAYIRQRLYSPPPSPPEQTSALNNIDWGFVGRALTWLGGCLLLATATWPICFAYIAWVIMCEICYALGRQELTAGAAPTIL